jgi:inositol-phosphate transport system permease protein
MEATTKLPESPGSILSAAVAGVGRGLRLALIACVLLLIGAVLLEWLFRPALAAGDVKENFTSTFAGLLVGLLPIAFYIAGGAAVRPLRKRHFMAAVVAAWVVASIGYGALIAYQAATGSGIFRQASTLGFAMRQTDAGIEVVSVNPGGAAEEAGILAGDVITALRRDPVNADQLQTLISQAQVDDVMRLRLLRGGEELQIATRVQLISQTDTASLARGLVIALAIALIALVMPSNWIPHLLILTMLLPLFTGYLWLIIATFSERTNGILPTDYAGNPGGWTLANWDFLSGASIGGPTANIFAVTMNSLGVAVFMTVVSLTVCSMTGYALSRMTFPGRQAFLSMSLILHGFPAVTLLIPIFFVLINLGNLPLIGPLFGYNTTGGIALVMIAFELPLGVWLMKGFFDNISWDMERSALIDGATRWRTFWEIILPQIRPGLLALGIFSFINGWNAYLIPATYSVGTGMATLPVYIRQLTGELAAVNWNQVAAVGLFQLIPIFVFFIFAQEYLLNIYAGGTKGSS